MLLHACCAGCTLTFLDAIKKETAITEEDITVIFDNPNIHPRSEYFARQKALKIVTRDKKCSLVFPNYKPGEYFSLFSSVTDDSSRKKITRDPNLRCPKCWTLRLSRFFEYARENGHVQVSSTLVTSPYINQDRLDTIATNLAKKFELKFYIPQECNCYQKKCGFYIQNYCGCIYSLLEKTEGKYFR